MKMISGDNTVECKDIPQLKVKLRELADGADVKISLVSPGTGAKRDFLLVKSNDALSGLRYQSNGAEFKWSTLERVLSYK